jgi:integrase
VLTTQVKGGEIVNREVDDPRVSAALEAYLVASGRRAGLGAADPLWTRHDRAGAPGVPLTGHAFARNLKRYARQAGLGDVHIHQLRHTFARLVSENTGSLLETQEALGHKNLDTTRVYVRRVAVQRDRYSRAILDRLGVEG